MNINNNAKVIREEGLDKFYTIPTYSKKCIDKVFELYDINNLTQFFKNPDMNFFFLNFGTKYHFTVLNLIKLNDRLIKFEALNCCSLRVNVRLQF